MGASENQFLDPDLKSRMSAMEGWTLVYFVVLPWVVVGLLVVCAKGCT